MEIFFFYILSKFGLLFHGVYSLNVFNHDMEILIFIEDQNVKCCKLVSRDNLNFLNSCKDWIVLSNVCEQMFIL